MPSIKKYRIVIGENATFNEKRAADIISRSIRLVTGKKLPIVTDAERACKYEIVVGKTKREKLDGLDFVHEADRNYDFIIRYVGTRLYLVGLGADKYFCAPYKTYAKMEDGAMGTVLAAYRFSQETLGYDVAMSVHDSYPELDDVEIDERCNVDFTREHMSSLMPKKIEGTAWYSVPNPVGLTQQGGSIFKTKSGKLVVVDGGVGACSEYFIKCLEHLSDGKKPVVHTWLFSHLHGDHYGVIYSILANEKYRERIEIENMYVGFPPLEYFTQWSPEANARYEEPYTLIHNIGEIMGTKLHRHVEGEHIVIDELDFKVVRVPKITGPAPEGEKLMNINDTSVLFLLTVEGQRILLLGDAERHCDEELLRDHREDLPCDILQVPHHGNGNVSIKCYEAMNAKLYLFQTCEMHWYSEGFEGINSRNIGMIRTFYFIKRLGVDNSRILTDSKGILSIELPVKNI